MRRGIVALLLALGVATGAWAQNQSINGGLVIQGAVNYCADVGATDAYACSLSPALKGYAIGAHYTFKANTANTAGATLNLNGLGALAILKLSSGALVPLVTGDIAAGSLVEVAYDGTQFQLISLPGASGGGGGGSGTVTNTGTLTANRLILGNGGVDVTAASSLTGLLLGNGASAPTAITTSAGLAAALSDETGSGAAVFATSPSLTTPTLGVATATSVNKVAITAPATSATLTIPDGVTLTGPSASGTVATLGLTNTFTGRQDASGAASTAPMKVGTVAALPGTCTVGDEYFANNATVGQNIYFCTATNTWTQQTALPRSAALADGTSVTPTSVNVEQNTHVNTQSAGTLTVNAVAGTPVDGQRLLIRLTSTNAQTYAWDSVYRGSADLALPTASTGSSKTDYLLFIWNSVANKWDLLSTNSGY